MLVQRAEGYVFDIQEIVFIRNWHNMTTETHEKLTVRAGNQTTDIVLSGQARILVFTATKARVFLISDIFADI